MARADRLGDPAQALVPQPLGREVLDDRSRATAPGPPVGLPCTKWYITSTAGTDARTVPRDGTPSRSTQGSGAMAEQVIDHTATTRADPLTVYALLADGSTWPEWSPIGAFELLDPGDGSPEGLGAVRLFTTGRHRSRERVVACRPPESFSYVLEAGLAVRDYRAVVTLTPVDGGTSINWRSTFRAKVPGTGPLYRRQLGALHQKHARGPGFGGRAGPSLIGAPTSGAASVGAAVGLVRHRGRRYLRGARRPGAAGTGTRRAPARPRPGGP